MSRKWALSLIFKMAVLCWAFTATKVWAQGVIVHGTVTDNLGQPVPGLTISFFHPSYGRGYPAFTNGLGQYVFYNVPPEPTPYFIEAYWGYTLVYRDDVQVIGPTQWDIRIR